MLTAEIAETSGSRRERSQVLVCPGVTMNAVLRSEESLGANNRRYNVGRNEGNPRSERSFALLRMTHWGVLCSLQGEAVFQNTTILPRTP